MKNPMITLVPLMFVGLASAQIPRPMGPFPDGSAAPSPSQRRADVRQAVDAQRARGEAGAAGESRLSPEARAAMRQQIRQQGKRRGDGDHKP